MQGCINGDRMTVVQRQARISATEAVTQKQAPRSTLSCLHASDLKLMTEEQHPRQMVLKEYGALGTLT